MKWLIHSSKISGTTNVPGDKSISHRALMLASLASGNSGIRNMAPGDDVHSTVRCLRGLGVDLEVTDLKAQIQGRGVLLPPATALDAGNSGTTMRLLSGILAGQAFQSRLTGDESLRRRPMRRVIDPLQAMGATIQSCDGKAPLTVQGASLQGGHYQIPVASAQVKSAMLLAGLFATGQVSLTELCPTRDHTERMFLATGIELARKDGVISMPGGQRPHPLQLTVPGDISSAAFLFVAAVLTGGRVTVPAMGTNPTRCGFLSVLQRMGCNVSFRNPEIEMGEPRAEVTVDGKVTDPISVEPQEVPLLVDEIPLIALLATQAHGASSIRGARELRVKESDRLAAIAHVLTTLGGNVDELPDGLVVRGPTPLNGGVVDGFGDHRIVMMAAIAGCCADGATVVSGVEPAAVSYPTFSATLPMLGGDVHET